MYLRTIELTGFKSFAGHTVLNFEPGLTAIVGPNGCGKSNIADAVRWVLGETSAKALRGAKMEDCIFNGTDERKPLGMAEVSVTFADCEAVLGTDYHEVTVTRRVFRSGEGEYFLNRTPCRLKDIQRLFMDTGIGTASYSLMEQGRIDQVLSSRPEDRREIFEEASGITRYKADKKEALRKLEQTEANLLRLDDVIREVKRQIGSLQRQAGKARRYRQLREQLQRLDTYWTARRLEQMDRERQAVEAQLAAWEARVNVLQAETQAAEAEEARLRAEVLETERAIGAATEARATAQARIEQQTQLVRMNGARIRELEELAARDRQDLEEAQRRAEEQRTGVASLTAALEQAGRERARAEQDWQREHKALLAQEQEIESLRRELDALQTQLLEAGTTLARLENEWRQTEGRERADLVRRERLLAEQAQIARSVADSEGQQQRLQEELTALRNEVSADEDRLAELRAQQGQAREGVAQLQRVCAGLREQLAVKRAQIELLEADEQQGRHFSDGARQLLDPANPLGVPATVILGALAAHLQVEPAYRVALEAVLRAWLDAVVVSDDAAGREVLRVLLRNRGGPVRLLAAAGPAAEPAATGVGERLRAHVTAAPPVAALVDRLLAGVWVVDSLEAVPQPVPPALMYVTPEGTVVRAGGAFEYWRAEAGASNPVARRHQLVELRKTLGGLEDELALREGSLAPLVGEQKGLELALQEAEVVLREHRRAVALKEGEFQIIAHAVRQARERLETVQWELQSLGKLSGEDETRRSLAARIETVRKQQAETRARLESETARLRELERGRSALYARVTELRVRFSEAAQRVEHLTSQGAPQQARLSELEDLIRGRTENLARYAETVAQLNAEIREAEEQVTNLRRSLVADNAEVDALRRQLDEKAARLRALAAEVAEKRTALDQARAEKSALEVTRAEGRLRRENLVERVTQEYGITVEDMLKAPEPEWDGERPDGQIPYEAAITELRSRIEALGPVNLVAIEECQELEERYAFLTNQQADLVRAKQQLVDMIRKINVTTAELFATTFAKINANFQTMFQRLFDGGAAKLVMINDEDVLETGIDIIVRPPGKRLQSVSLLSGGERTLTAVALLFAIYLIKPSPFCLLDELDAALDESNIGRFVNLLNEFLGQSQFIVITHNRRTIAAANVIYGITMEEMGVSKVVSMKFSEYERSSEFQTDGGPGSKPGAAGWSGS